MITSKQNHTNQINTNFQSYPTYVQDTPNVKGHLSFFIFSHTTFFISKNIKWVNVKRQLQIYTRETKGNKSIR